MRYLDSASRSHDQTVQAWLDDLMSTATYFACQSAYFGADALAEYESPIRSLLAGGGEFHLVVGFNSGGLRSQDLTYVLDLIEDYDERATLRIAGADDVLMHPKSFYIETSDGIRHGLVGSANLTIPGLSSNIEAALAVDSASDPSAPLDEIRDAILAWGSTRAAYSQLVTRATLPELIDDAAVDAKQPTKPSIPPEKSSRLRRLFPPLGNIPGVRLPRRMRGESTSDGPEASAGTAEQSQTAVIPPATPFGTRKLVEFRLPGGARGIVKRLSSLDTKAFRGESGTPYIALPGDLAPLLPMLPAGRNGEPRLDIDVMAELDTLPGSEFRHTPTRGSTNITYVGMGLISSSNQDLRFNFLMPITRAILEATKAAGVRPPAAGDAAVIEFVDVATVRLSFVTQEPLRAQLLTHAVNARDSWGWLQDAVELA